MINILNEDVSVEDLVRLSKKLPEKNELVEFYSLLFQYCDQCWTGSTHFETVELFRKVVNMNNFRRLQINYSVEKIFDMIKEKLENIIHNDIIPLVITDDTEALEKYLSQLEETPHITGRPCLVQERMGVWILDKVLSLSTKEAILDYLSYFFSTDKDNAITQLDKYITHAISQKAKLQCRILNAFPEKPED